MLSLFLAAPDDFEIPLEGLQTSESLGRRAKRVSSTARGGKGATNNKQERTMLFFAFSVCSLLFCSSFCLFFICSVRALTPCFKEEIGREKKPKLVFRIFSIHTQTPTCPGPNCISREREMEGERERERESGWVPRQTCAILWQTW